MTHEKAHQIWDDLVPQFEALPDVELTRMFGSIGLGVRGKVFAFVGKSGALIAKVGEERTTEIEQTGLGERTILGGRAMKEWVSLHIENEDIWADVMTEAHTFVDSITPQ